jgi:phage tail-like protein
VNANRRGPYRNFRILVKWKERYVAGFDRMSASRRTIETIKRRPGGGVSPSRKGFGRSEHGPITLEGDVTHDAEFEDWANRAWSFEAGLGAEMSLDRFRKDIIIELLNEAGQVATAYKVHGCLISDYQALPDLDANANAVAIQHMKLENEGWERDTSSCPLGEPEGSGTSASEVAHR